MYILYIKYTNNSNNNLLKGFLKRVHLTNANLALSKNANDK